MKHFIILLNLSFFGLSFAKADTSPDEVSLHLNKSKQAIWNIRVQHKSNHFGDTILKFVLGLSGSSGTGFFIGPNYFVTNLHVIFSLLGSTSSSTVTLSQEGNSSSLKVKRVLAISALYDLALLETEESITDYLSLRENLPNPDGNLFLLGYPGGIFKKIEKTGNIIYENEKEFAFTTDNSNLNGASGSPVLDEKGQVVGVTSSGAANKLNVIKINHLRELIIGDIGISCAETEFFKAKNCIKEEIEHLKKLAEGGSIYAQEEIAFMYLKGNVEIAHLNFEKALGLEKFEKAFQWYKMAAEQGVVAAQGSLAVMYYYGQGTQKNINQAVKWFEKAAKQGDPPAQYKLALMHYEGIEINQNFEKAFQWGEKAADQGYAPAQSLLAQMYTEGEAVDQDLEEAVYLIQKAVETGYAKAQHQIAFMYYRGEGFDQDINQALHWFERAAEQEHTEAQYQLAHMYYKGEGLDRDINQALEWFKRAALRGHIEAQHKLARLYFKAGFLRDLNQAFYWCDKAVEQDYAPARTLLYLIEKEKNDRRP